MAGNQMTKMFMQFLNTFRCEKGETITHTTTDPFRGSYHIPADKLEMFYKLILKQSSPPFIIERIPDINAPKKLFLDFDFKQKLGESRTITVEDIDNLISAIVIELHKLFGIEKVRVIVQQRKSGYEIDTIFKDGLHILIPDILLPIPHQYILREHIINNYGKTLWEGRFINSYEDIVDKVVIKDNGWYLQYCGKYGIGAYETIIDETLVYIDDDNLERLESPKTEGIELIKLCSYSHNEGAIIYNLKEEYLPKESLQTTKQTSTKQTMAKVAVINDSDTSLLFDEIREILQNLAPFRKVAYDDWSKVAFCCKNIEVPTKIFIDWSAPEDIYKATAFYENIKVREAKGYSKRTLYKWLKEDNLIIYERLISENNYKAETDIATLLAEFNNGDIAQYYYECNPYKYNYCPKVGWFSYNQNGILIHSKEFPVCLHNSIEDFLKKIIKTERRKLVEGTKDFKKKMNLSFKNYKSAGTSSVLSDIMKFLKIKYNCNDILDKIDINYNLLAFSNLVYDLQIKGFRKIEPCKDFIMKNCGYNIDTKSNPEIRKDIHNVLISIFNTDEMVQFWLKVQAKMFFGNPNQNLFIFSGGGGNGKGILAGCIESMLGSYYYTVEPTFLQTKFKADKGNSSLAQSKGCRYLSLSEPDDDTNFNASFMKSLSGGDTMQARDVGVRNEGKGFKNKSALGISCNDIPGLDKVNQSMIRRLIIIKFMNTFVACVSDPTKQRLADYGLEERLSQPTFVNEFMLYILEVASSFDDFKAPILLPKEVSDATSTYFDESNPVKLWLHENYNITGKCSDLVSSTDLLTEYNCEAVKRITAKQLKEKMAFENIHSDKKSGIMKYIGLQKKPVEIKEATPKSELPCLI